MGYVGVAVCRLYQDLRMHEDWLDKQVTVAEAGAALWNTLPMGRPEYDRRRN